MAHLAEGENEYSPSISRELDNKKKKQRVCVTARNTFPSREENKRLCLTVFAGFPLLDRDGEGLSRETSVRNDLPRQTAAGCLMSPLTSARYCCRASYSLVLPWRYWEGLEGPWSPSWTTSFLAIYSIINAHIPHNMWQSKLAEGSFIPFP